MPSRPQWYYALISRQRGGEESEKEMRSSHFGAGRKKRNHKALYLSRTSEYRHRLAALCITAEGHVFSWGRQGRSGCLGGPDVTSNKHVRPGRVKLPGPA